MGAPGISAGEARITTAMAGYEEPSPILAMRLRYSFTAVAGVGEGGRRAFPPERFFRSAPGFRPFS